MTTKGIPNLLENFYIGMIIWSNTLSKIHSFSRISVYYMNDMGFSFLFWFNYAHYFFFMVGLICLKIEANTKFWCKELFSIEFNTMRNFEKSSALKYIIYCWLYKLPASKYKWNILYVLRIFLKYRYYISNGNL